MARRKRSRRANGEGAAYYHKGKQKYCCEKEIGGKCRYFYGDTPKDAARKRDEAVEQFNRAGFVPQKNYDTVREWGTEWLKVYKISVLTEGGYASYEDDLNIYVYPYLGDVKLKQLTPVMVQTWVNDLCAHGRKDGKGLAPRTVRRAHGVLKGALDRAVKERLLAFNPASRDMVDLPKLPPSMRKPFFSDDAAAFLDDIKDDFLYDVIFVDMSSGWRRGEICGLQWPQVDLKNKTALICRQRVMYKGKPKDVEYVKTDQSYRVSVLPDEVIPVLERNYKRYRARLASNKLAGQQIYSEDPYVFCWPDGRPYSPDYLRRRLQKLLKKHSYENRRFHDLRHTFATIALENDADLKSIQEAMGHASIETTSEYTKLSNTRKTEVAAKVGGALIKAKK